MLENLLRHNNLGSQSQIIYILELLSQGDYSIQDLRMACISKEYAFSNSFNGVVRLLEWLNIIKVSNLVKLHNNINLNDFIINICHLFFLKLAEEKQLHHFLNNNNLDFKKSIYVRNNLIKLRFSPLRNFLIKLDFFKSDNLIYNQFVINDEFSTWFIDNILSLIERSQITDNSLDNLKNKQKNQEKAGVEAEEFVLKYEKTQRGKHSKVDNIKIISGVDVSAGYDIQSYKTDKSILLDKFIEVKSHSGIPYFYWSKNEMKAAEQEEENYFLYLVDRDKMDDVNYRPIVIQNPHKNILNNSDWNKNCQSWKFEKTTKCFKI